MSQYVRLKMGLPVPTDFIASEGTPIVIDGLTSIAYYLRNNEVFPIVGWTPAPPSPNGFSTGFSNGFE